MSNAYIRVASSFQGRHPNQSSLEACGVGHLPWLLVSIVLLPTGVCLVVCEFAQGCCVYYCALYLLAICWLMDFGLEDCCPLSSWILSSCLLWMVFMRWSHLIEWQHSFLAAFHCLLNLVVDIWRSLVHVCRTVSLFSFFWPEIKSAAFLSYFVAVSISRISDWELWRGWWAQLWHGDGELESGVQLDSAIWFLLGWSTCACAGRCSLGYCQRICQCLSTSSFYQLLWAS